MDDAFAREIAVIVDELRSPKQRSRLLANFAREEIAVTQMENEKAIGRAIRSPLVTVDGRRGAPLATVKPDGTIVAEFNSETEPVRWVIRQLRMHSPFLTGDYQNSHLVFADGKQVDPDAELPDAKRFVIVNAQPYARKIEKGLSSQAPAGVYEAVAAVALRQFGQAAKIYFGYQGVRGGELEADIGIGRLQAGVERSTSLRGKAANRKASALLRKRTERRFPAITIETE